MTKPLMSCGHAANGSTVTGKPVCVICNNETVRAGVKLEGRFAKCLYGDCGTITPSEMTLPFFELREGKDFDQYFCGCRGWD